MKHLLIAACLTLGLGACSDAPTAERVLRQAGYTRVTTRGHSWFGCSEKESFATAFTATSPSGEVVTGAVCSGWLKSATIRFD